MRLTKHIPALIAMTKQLISSCYASHLSPIHTFSPNQPSHALVSSSQRRFQTAMDFINTFLSQGCVDPTSGKADITLCITSRARTVRSFLPLAVDVWECHTFNNHLHEVQIVGLIDAILSYTSSDSQRVPQRLSNCAWIALKNLLPSSSNVDYTTSSFVFKLVELIRRAFVSTPLPQSSSFSRYKNMRLMMHTMVFCYSAQLDRGYSNSGFRSCLDILMLCTRGRRQGMKNLLSLIDEGIGANQDDTLSPLDILLFEVVTQCTRLPFLRVALEVVSSSDYRSARVVDIARQCVLHTFIAKELVNPRCNTGIVTSQQQVVMALRSIDDREHIMRFAAFLLRLHHDELMADWAGFTAHSSLRVDIDFRGCPARARGCFQASSYFPDRIVVHVIVPTICKKLELTFAVDLPSNVTARRLSALIRDFESTRLQLLS
ncbi:hypothetical protein PC9H_010214 [Pleurotus ostreatus]|uniref:Uncharacterized protein n=1 Tax=Pleurotus ostreatus TaxID=5322 RepID=A0A8H7DRD1_PLEOS|nr:uncharacterized protein PC9H_010214 [Pleurotus ostreatus]KAF7424903.1 hypothetical protein PC9H_010214 [Pleurotus ostreatus]